MTDEAEEQGLQPRGNPPSHADERPVNQGGTTETLGEEESGLGPRGETPQHTEEFSRIQTTSRGGGAATSAVRSDDPNPQPADE